MDSYNIHNSEWAWAGLDYAATLENNGTVDELYKQINELII
jgi:hypothetical protein